MVLEDELASRYIPSLVFAILQYPLHLTQYSCLECYSQATSNINPNSIVINKQCTVFSAAVENFTNGMG